MNCGECIHLDEFACMFVCSMNGDVLHVSPDYLPIQTADCIREQHKAEVCFSVGDTSPNFGPMPFDYRR